MTGSAACPASPPAFVHPAFVKYPAQAAFGRTLPKNKLYAHSRAGTRLKNLFVQQVEQIVWQFKLAPETINLPARPAVPEIQVFGIQLKTPELSFDVLRAIDQAVQFPIIFELAHAGRMQVVACHKRPSEADASRWVLSDYFASGWLADPAERGAMPVALHLGGLYEQLLRALLPLPARPHETLAEHVARLDALAAKQREADKTAAKLEKERQFNRKVAINADLRRLQTELEALRR
ncbi:MAG: DUF4391 domain-containing protein [Burkholderiales bacterium]|jgi:hypothetical protein|nr:DUF4391 domain-containing protein [Burkholderiales bacterium]